MKNTISNNTFLRFLTREETEPLSSRCRFFCFVLVMTSFSHHENVISLIIRFENLETPIQKTTRLKEVGTGTPEW